MSVSCLLSSPQPIEKSSAFRTRGTHTAASGEEGRRSSGGCSYAGYRWERDLRRWRHKLQCGNPNVRGDQRLRHDDPGARIVTQGAPQLVVQNRTPGVMMCLDRSWRDDDVSRVRERDRPSPEDLNHRDNGDYQTFHHGSFIIL